MLSVALNGTITVEQIQAEIDKTLEMPLKQLLVEYSKYKKVVADCESKIEAFDVSAVQAKVDALTAEYSAKIKGSSAYNHAILKDEYNQKVDALEFELITKPLNDLALKRYEAREYMFIYEAKLKDYVNANRELIAEEIKQAKREEIRGSLLGLADFVEGA